MLYQMYDKLRFNLIYKDKLQIPVNQEKVRLTGMCVISMGHYI